MAGPGDGLSGHGPVRVMAGPGDGPRPGDGLSGHGPVLLPVWRPAADTPTAGRSVTRLAAGGGHGDGGPRPGVASREVLRSGPAGGWVWAVSRGRPRARVPAGALRVWRVLRPVRPWVSPRSCVPHSVLGRVFFRCRPAGLFRPSGQARASRGGGAPARPGSSSAGLPAWAAAPDHSCCRGFLPGLRTGRELATRRWLPPRRPCDAAVAWKRPWPAWRRPR